MKRAVCYLLPAAIALVLAGCGNIGSTPRSAPGGEPIFGSAEALTPGVDPFLRADHDGPLLDIIPAAWFVELEGTPRIDGGDLTTLDAIADTFISTASAMGIDFDTRYHFSVLLHGYSLTIDRHDVVKLLDLPGVKGIYPVEHVELPELTATSEPQMTTALAMTGADVAQTELGLTGEGVRIGIVDSGVSLTHPEFAGRIVAGFDLVGDLYHAGIPERSVPVPEPGPGTRPGGGDCMGHGTHVAGIAASGGVNITGVAPAAEIGTYRVFGCAGSSAMDVIIRGVEMAYEDGMDIVNLSLGAFGGWPQGFGARALSRVMDLGMIPVASIGNDGPLGTFAAGSPGVGENVIGVAAYDNVFLEADTFLLNGETQIPYTVLATTPAPPLDGTTPEIVYVGRGCIGDDYLADPDGLVALITRGECTFNEKYQRAADAGAAGVIIENNQPGLFFGGGVVPTDIFGIAVSQEDGELIKDAQEPFVEWTDERIFAENPTGDLVSGFSSYGPAPDLSLKPNIGAPGGFINAPYFSDEENTYAVLGGTSMSSPYIAGGIALLLEANRRDNLGILPHQVRDILQSTAEPKPWSLAPDIGFFDAVHRQGAGMMQIARAVEAQTRVFPAQLELGESVQGPVTETLAIENLSDAEVTYTLENISNVVATGGVNPGSPGFFGSGAAALFEVAGEEVTEITVPAGGVRNVNVTVLANPGLPDNSVYGGYLSITPQNGNPSSVQVPYLGFKGDYQALPTFSVPPVMVRVVGPVAEVRPPGARYSMRGDDLPMFAFVLLNPAQRLQAQIVPLGHRGWVSNQPILDTEFVRRSPPAFVYGFPTVDASALPDGEYTIRVAVLKPGGDAQNPDHVTVRHSPPFFIDRSQ